MGRKIKLNTRQFWRFHKWKRSIMYNDLLWIKSRHLCVELLNHFSNGNRKDFKIGCIDQNLIIPLALIFQLCYVKSWVKFEVLFVVVVVVLKIRFFYTTGKKYTQESRKYSKICLNPISIILDISSLKIFYWEKFALVKFL